jgi:hypothetical protein
MGRRIKPTHCCEMAPLAVRPFIESTSLLTQRNHPSASSSVEAELKERRNGPLGSHANQDGHDYEEDDAANEIDRRLLDLFFLVLWLCSLTRQGVALDISCAPGWLENLVFSPDGPAFGGDFLGCRVEKMCVGPIRTN